MSMQDIALERAWIDTTETESDDAEMMRRCIALARSARSRGEVPYAAVIARRGKFVCEVLNRVHADHDVLRHAELMAVSNAQRILGTVDLSDCTMYSTVEPCPMCAYAAREARVGRVFFGLHSPVMGGYSRWNVLTDQGLADRLPEVFAQPPVIVAGYKQAEVMETMRGWNPLFWEIIKDRQLITSGSVKVVRDRPTSVVGRWLRDMMAFLRYARFAALDCVWRI